MGGGGFTMKEPTQALDELVLELTEKPVPRLCFLPTASGDPREQVTRFYERFGDLPCEPSVLSLFHLGRDRIDPIAHLKAQDVIYVGGGSLRNMLAIWREHGVDIAMREAWATGVVLAGLSAGAMCWFQGGISMSGGAPEPVRCLGLLPGSLSVHLDGEPQRLPAYREAVAAGRLPGGYAADDGAALVFSGTTLLECVASRPQARVVRVRSDGDGGLIEQELPIRLPSRAGAGVPGLAGAGDRGSTSGAGDPDGISELRALRAGRRRWE
jgi:peptidase E